MNFELINEFNKKKLNINEENNKNFIKYQEYELNIENNIVKVLIPLRECEKFENHINNISKLNIKELKDILYIYRGYRNLKK